MFLTWLNISKYHSLHMKQRISILITLVFAFVFVLDLIETSIFDNKGQQNQNFEFQRIESRLGQKVKIPLLWILRGWGLDKIEVALCSICFAKPVQKIQTYPWLQLYYCYVIRFMCCLWLCCSAVFSNYSILHSFMWIHFNYFGFEMFRQKGCHEQYLLYLIKSCTLYSFRKNIKDSNNSLIQNGVTDTMNMVLVVIGSHILYYLVYFSHLITPVMNSTIANYIIHVWH